MHKKINVFVLNQIFTNLPKAIYCGHNINNCACFNSLHNYHAMNTDKAYTFLEFIVYQHANILYLVSTMNKYLEAKLLIF